VEKTYISLNFPTVISIWLAALLGYALLVGASMAYKYLTRGA
jgi:hypothetical protein